MDSNPQTLTDLRTSSRQSRKAEDSRQILEKRELRVQKAIEIYEELCQRITRKARLSFMLKSYDFCLQTKLYEDSDFAGFDWIRKTLPPRPQL